MKVNIKVIEGGIAPEKKSEGAICYDVYARQIVVDGQEGKVTVKLGFAIEVPKDYGLVLVPRSNIRNSRYILQNSEGQIDQDFRGECEASFIGIPNIEHIQETNQLKFDIGRFPYKPGERVGQIYLRKVYDMEFNKVDILSETVRGEGGHGSTGK